MCPLEGQLSDPQSNSSTRDAAILQQTTFSINFVLKKGERFCAITKLPFAKKVSRTSIFKNWFSDYTRFYHQVLLWNGTSPGNDVIEFRRAGLSHERPDALVFLRIQRKIIDRNELKNAGEIYYGIGAFIILFCYPILTSLSESLAFMLTIPKIYEISNTSKVLAQCFLKVLRASWWSFMVPTPFSLLCLIL